MAKRSKRPLHTDACKEKIQTSQLINRLQDHIHGKLAKPMDSSQVTAALGLLKKVMPDLSAVDQKNETTIATLSDKPMPTDEQWEAQYKLQ